MNTIVLCGGGTAGHVMPNIALLKHLKQHFKNIYYIGSVNGIEKEILSEYPEVKYYPITTVKLIRGFNLKNLLIPFKLLKGFNECKKILKELKPNIIFSKGGYVSVPVTFAAKKLKIPVVAHESDFNLGLANRLILKNCTKMCCSFEETAKSLNEKGVFTLSPVRDSLFYGNKEKAKLACGFNNYNKTILVIGGSLGAKAINECVFKIAPELTKNFNVIHVVGKGNLNKNLKLKNYYQIEFLSSIENYFALSDLVVSRAGSNAINEFLVLNKPMLLIPLPKGNSRGDQILNAQNFKEHGFAEVLFQENLNEQSLLKNINLLNQNANLIKQKQAKFKGKNGTENVLKVILDNVKKQ